MIHHYDEFMKDELAKLFATVMSLLAQTLSKPALNQWNVTIYISNVARWYKLDSWMWACSKHDCMGRNMYTVTRYVPRLHLVSSTSVLLLLLLLLLFTVKSWFLLVFPELVCEFAVVSTRLLCDCLRSLLVFNGESSKASSIWSLVSIGCRSTLSLVAR